MLDSLEITNWKTHKKTSLNFQKGVNVLIGVMGAGKSSTMDAVSFALFGTFPALNSKRITLPGLITNRPVQETEAAIKLSFTVDNDQYTVTRKIGDNGNSAKLEKNGQHFQTQPTKVTEEIESILKIDYDTFSRVVYSEQNRLDYFLELPKGERKKQIDHMLGLDSFATAEENATSLINSIKGMINLEEESLVRTEIATIRKQFKQLNDEKETLKKEQEKLQTEEKKLKETLDSSKKKSEASKKALATKKEISEEIAKIKSKIATINEEIKKIETMKIDENIADNLKKIEAEEAKLSKEIDQLRKNERVKSKEQGDIEANLKINKRRQEEREKIIAEIKNEDEKKVKLDLEKADTELQRITTDFAAKKGKSKELVDWASELSKHISKCPVCERDIPEEMKKSLIENKSSSIEAIEKEIKQLEKLAETRKTEITKLTELQNKLVVANKRLLDYKDLDTLIENGAKDQKRAAAEMEKLQKELEKLTKEHETSRNALTDLKNKQQITERKKNYESEIKQTSVVLEKKEKELSAIDVDEKLLYALQEEITKQSAALSDTTSKMHGNDKLLQNLETQLKEKQKQILDYEAMEKRILKKQSQLGNLNKFKIALVETETLLRNKLVSSINSLMQNLWPRLYPYGDYTSIRLDAKKDDYLLEVNTNVNGSAQWIQVDGIASGGERTVGCLGMRIALAMVVVPNLKWLILDEPTHNIDSTGIAKLIDVFGDELPNVVEQIFIITHDDNLKQITSAKVYQFDRDKALSAPTAITEI